MQQVTKPKDNFLNFQWSRHETLLWTMPECQEERPGPTSKEKWSQKRLKDQLGFATSPKVDHTPNVHLHFPKTVFLPSDSRVYMEEVAQLVEHSSSIHEALGSVPSTVQINVVINTCLSSYQRVGSRRFRSSRSCIETHKVWGHPWLRETLIQNELTPKHIRIRMPLQVSLFTWKLLSELVSYYLVDWLCSTRASKRRTQDGYRKGFVCLLFFVMSLKNKLVYE